MTVVKHYSYFIVKPDGIIKQLYHKHYEEKGEKFKKSFESYLYGLSELFGNEAVLILVSDGRKTYQELMELTYKTKMKIREQYMNKNLAFVTDYGYGEGYIREHPKMEGRKSKEQ